MWFNGTKIAFISKKKKIIYNSLPIGWDIRPQTQKTPAAADLAPDPPMWYVWVKLALETRLQS